jgi:hypothetical protein
MMSKPNCTPFTLSLCSQPLRNQHLHSPLSFVRHCFDSISIVLDKPLFARRLCSIATSQSLAVLSRASPADPKYAAAGIFFKYAHDVYGIYGGNEAAAKAAGHEARSHAALASLSGSSLRQPLCIVLDYLGYRLICMALLPISQRSLQYGSADGGRHVLCKHEGIARRPPLWRARCILKKHRTGLPSSRSVRAHDARRSCLRKRVPSVSTSARRQRRLSQ